MTQFNALEQEFRRNRYWYAGIGILLFAGILIGTIGALKTGEQELQGLDSYLRNFFSAYPMQGVSKGEVFRLSMLNHLRLTLLLWISGWFVWLIPVAALQVLSKGIKTGFTIAFLLHCHGGKGLLLAAASILPQNFILLPAVLVYAVFQMQFALMLRRLRSTGGTIRGRKNIYIQNLLGLFIFMLIALLCSLMEAFVLPTLIRPLCSFFG